MMVGHILSLLGKFMCWYRKSTNNEFTGSGFFSNFFFLERLNISFLRHFQSTNFVNGRHGIVEGHSHSRVWYFFWMPIIKTRFLDWGMPYSAVFMTFQNTEYSRIDLSSPIIDSNSFPLSIESKPVTFSNTKKMGFLYRITRHIPKRVFLSHRMFLLDFCYRKRLARKSTDISINIRYVF